MREVIFKECEQIDTGLKFQENCSSLYLASGDIDGDGLDEVVLCNTSGPIAIIKESTIYHIRQLNIDSVCSLNICPIYGNSKSEIITISLTGVCTVFLSENLKEEGFDNGDDNQNNSTPEIVLKVVLKQRGMKNNSTASKIFK